MASRESLPPRYADDVTQQEQTTIDDLIPMTEAHFDVVTEVKPEVTVTIVISKDAGGELLQAVEQAFHSLDWVRYVEIPGELDITPVENTLRITGDFHLTAHFDPDTVPADPSHATKTVETRLENTDIIQGVEHVALRMPPYQIQPY